MPEKQETVLDEVKESVQQAAKKLAAISPEYERVSWLLEDALLLLDEKEEDISVAELLERELGDEYVQVNARNS